MAQQGAEEGKNYSNNEDFHFILVSVAHQTNPSGTAEIFARTRPVVF